jgi:hypothetical protein
MRQRAVPTEAANDNVRFPPRGPARSAPDLPPTPLNQTPPARSEPFRIGLRPLLVAGFSGLILLTLSGACLIGLAAVGLVAGAMGGVQLIGRRLLSPARALGTPDPRVLGYRP